MSIDATHLSFAYGKHPVLRNLSFRVEDGAFLSVLGPNGTGKSTLLRCMLGLLSGYTGSITINGQDIRRIPIREMARKCAYIPQAHYPAFNYTVLDMVLMGLTHQMSYFASPGKAERQAALERLEQMGIAALSSRSFQRLSGGEQQLTLMARALAQQACILIMDEPTANLDLGNRMLVLDKMRELANTGHTIIQSTHDPEQSYLYSDLVLALQDGRILALGKPQEIITGALMRSLYGAAVTVESLRSDRLRVCVPQNIIEDVEEKET